MTYSRLELAVAASVVLFAVPSCARAQTFFHLDRATMNNQEVLVHVYYDGSPVAAKLLDLKVEYEPSRMILVDVRPLAALESRGIAVQSSHLSTMVLRLVVVDAASAQAIPTGALVELVFQRKDAFQTSVRFGSDAVWRRSAISPDQGPDATRLLRDESWGAPVQVSAAQPDGNRLLLSYAFDERDPLEYADVVDQDALCARIGACKNAPTDADRRRFKERLETLQAGRVAVSSRTDGVAGPALYFGGLRDHVRLPITLSKNGGADEQSFSLAAWFYAEGYAAGDKEDTPQLLFGHQTTSEKTRFGVKVLPATADAVKLVWFEGDLDSPSREVMFASALPKRVWTHLGLTVDPKTRAARVFLDGVAVQQLTIGAPSTPVVSCPRFETGTSGLLLHEEGDVVGARRPEWLHYASARDNLWGIRRVDPDGFADEEILRDGKSSFQDPDYSPIVDKLVYSANVGGSFEIWIADADGAPASRKQITRGFGDTGRGIFARRPRWAPDASAIVFESNAYDVDRRDNVMTRGYHLYYVRYDPAANVVSVPLEAGGIAGELSYGDRVRDQTIDAYRLTTANRNHSGARWIAGRGTADLGSVLFTSADERFQDREVHRLTIAEAIRGSNEERLEGLGSSSEDDVALLAAYRWVTAGQPPRVDSKLLVEKVSWSLDTDNGFVTTVAAGPTEPSPECDREQRTPGSPGTIDVTIAQPSRTFPERCWDLNRNMILDPDEDLDKDGAGTSADCYPTEATIRVLYDATTVRPLLCESDLATARALEPRQKSADLRERNFGARAYVQVDVRSDPLAARPIVAMSAVAKLRFERLRPGDPHLALQRLTRKRELLLKDLTSSTAPTALRVDPALDEVLAAEFAPDGSRLALAGIGQARPTLVRTGPSLAADGSARILPAPARINGMSWTRRQQLYACNWLGAYRKPSGEYVAGFRGALDDLRVYSYVREDAGFRSDHDRGRERLRRTGRTGPVASRLPSCGTSDLECPPFHRCVGGQCAPVSCVPGEPYACCDAAHPTSGPRGACARVPAPIAPAGPPWACSVECNYDNQCFRQECLNGPCRFCGSASSSCVECERKIVDLGGIRFARVEGCPDQNSFACEAGSCVTACYANANGQSTYLCDPALEYCRAGRCTLFDWRWDDLSPASLSGLDEVRYKPLQYSIARPQLYPVEIKAYGVEDYGRPPEVVVEGRVTTAANQVYGGRWFQIGSVLVYHRTKSDAQAKPYVLHVPFKVDEVRLRQVRRPYDDLNAAATGLVEDGQIAPFCKAELDAWAAAQGLTTPVDYAPCYHRPPGSRHWLGYAVGISWAESCRAAVERGRPCPADTDANSRFLLPGSPKVIVLDVSVQGTSYLQKIASNPICSYEGGTEPLAAGETARKVFFGDVSREISNEKTAYCAGHPCPATALVDLAPSAGGSWALLNCTYASETDPSQRAGITIAGVHVVEGVGGPVKETANGCFVERGATTEPCFEWMSDASLDPLNAATETHQLLEFGGFRSFAHSGDGR